MKIVKLKLYNGLDIAELGEPREIADPETVILNIDFIRSIHPREKTSNFREVKSVIKVVDDGEYYSLNSVEELWKIIRGQASKSPQNHAYDHQIEAITLGENF